MSDYHTQELFNTRLAIRREVLAIPLPHTIFYHASLMPGWEAIVAEQLALAAYSGLTRICSFIIASRPKDVHRFIRSANRFGIEIEVLGEAADFRLGEGPTINAIHSWATQHPVGSVLYFHTKGVSKPNCSHKRHWRRAMMRHVVAEWKHNLGKLTVDDLVGCAWQQDPKYPHFCGNFWAARADWLASLPHPDTYRFGRSDFNWAGTPHSWQKRIYVETWIGARPYHSVHDRIAFGFPLWSGRVFEVDYNVPGFDYERDFCLEVGL